MIARYTDEKETTCSLRCQERQRVLLAPVVLEERRCCSRHSRKRGHCSLNSRKRGNSSLHSRKDTIARFARGRQSSSLTLRSVSSLRSLKTEDMIARCAHRRQKTLLIASLAERRRDSTTASTHPSYPSCSLRSLEDMTARFSRGYLPLPEQLSPH